MEEPMGSQARNIIKYKFLSPKMNSINLES